MGLGNKFGNVVAFGAMSKSGGNGSSGGKGGSSSKGGSSNTSGGTAAQQVMSSFTGKSYGGSAGKGSTGSAPQLDNKFESGSIGDMVVQQAQKTMDNSYEKQNTQRSDKPSFSDMPRQDGSTIQGSVMNMAQDTAARAGMKRRNSGLSSNGSSLDAFDQ